MTTQDNGVAAIVDQVETVTDILMDFLLTICEDEIVNLEGLWSESSVHVLVAFWFFNPKVLAILYLKGMVKL